MIVTNELAGGQRLSTDDGWPVSNRMRANRSDQGTLTLFTKTTCGTFGSGGNGNSLTMQTTSGFSVAKDARSEEMTDFTESNMTESLMPT